MPTLLLVSANDPDNRLNQLSNETKEIQRTLNKTYGKAYDVALTPDASIQDLIEELKIPNREIEVLHYAGHAESTFIQLTDGDANAEALAEKLQRLQSLKLVFLNGCATKSITGLVVRLCDFFRQHFTMCCGLDDGANVARAAKALCCTIGTVAGFFAEQLAAKLGLGSRLRREKVYVFILLPETKEKSVFIRGHPWHPCCHCATLV